MHGYPSFLCIQSKALQLLDIVKYLFSEEKPSVNSYFTKRSNLLGQIMVPRRGNSHTEFRSAEAPEAPKRRSAEAPKRLSV